MQKNIKLLSWFNFFTDFKLYSPIMILYFAKVTGSFALGMSIFSIAMIASAFFEVPTGVLSDYVGRKRTVSFGALSAVLYAIFYAIGSFYWILLIGAIFEGLSRSFYSGNNDALLHDSLYEKGEVRHYEEYLGRISSMFQIALAVSAVIGSVIANWSFSLVMWISVIPQIICLILSFFLIEPNVRSKESANIFIHLKKAIMLFVKNKKLRLLNLSSVIKYAIGESTFHFQAAFYVLVWPIWAIGISKLISYIGASFSFFYSGRILKKYRHIKLLITSALYNRIVTIIAVVYPTVFSPVLMSSTSLFFGVSEVAKNSLFQKEFKKDVRATMGSLNAFAGSVVFGLFAYFLGYIADIFSPAMAILFFQILSLPIIWLYWKIYKLDKK